MSKQNIFYWLCTGLFAAAMIMSGVLHFIHYAPMEVAMQGLGYPLYVSTLLGVLKVAGAITLLAPAPPRLKEWAYAGFAFDILGAAWSHYSSAQSIVAPVIVAIPFVASYWLYLRRPAAVA